MDNGRSLGLICSSQTYANWRPVSASSNQLFNYSANISPGTTQAASSGVGEWVTRTIIFDIL